MTEAKNKTKNTSVHDYKHTSKSRPLHFLIQTYIKHVCKYH